MKLKITVRQYPTALEHAHGFRGTNQEAIIVDTQDLGPKDYEISGLDVGLTIEKLEEKENDG